MHAWIDRLAEALGEESPSETEATRLLAASRDVAHRVERKMTPLAAFLVGSAVGRSVDRGIDRAEAFETVLADLERLLPPPVPEGASDAKA
ncbi:MAG: DUF6457 domain-containing protein [Actinobacteria bacterium]|nr:DUF6457 domain-containing protein [Actinomycetota bacterium]